MVSDFRSRCVWRRWESIKLSAARQPPWSSGEVESRWSKNLPFPSSKAVLWARTGFWGVFPANFSKFAEDMCKKRWSFFCLMGSYGLCVKVNGCQFGRAQVLLVWWNWETASRQMRRCGIGDVRVAQCFSRGKNAWQPGPTNYWSQWCFSSHCWNWSLGIAGVVFYCLKHYSGCYYVLMAWLIDVDSLGESETEELSRSGATGGPPGQIETTSFFFAAASSSSRGQILYVGISKNHQLHKNKWIKRHFVWSDFNRTDFKVNSMMVLGGINHLMDLWTIFLLPFLSISRALRDCSRRRLNSACCMSEWVYFTHGYRLPDPKNLRLQTAQLLWRNAVMNHGGGPSSNGGDLVNLSAWWSASLSPWFLSEISHLHRNVLCMSKTFNLGLAKNDVKHPMRVPWGFRNRLRQTFPEGFSLNLD